MPAPRLLSPADQRLSDNAVEAAARSNEYQRTAAHRMVDVLAPDGASPAWRASIYSAYLTVRRQGGDVAPAAAEVRAMAHTLHRIQQRHEAAVAERREAA